MQGDTASTTRKGKTKKQLAFALFIFPHPSNSNLSPIKQTKREFDIMSRGDTGKLRFVTLCHQALRHPSNPRLLQAGGPHNTLGLNVIAGFI